MAFVKIRKKVFFGRHALLHVVLRPSTDFPFSCEEGLDFNNIS